MKNIQYVVLINMLVSFILSFLIALVSPAVTSIVNGLYFLAILVPAIAGCVRRMHDVDNEWWYALIPLYNLILTITPGTPGPPVWSRTCLRCQNSLTGQVDRHSIPILS